MAHPTTDTDPSGLAPVMWLGALISLGFGIAFFWLATYEKEEPKPDHPMAFVPLTVDHDRLEAERNRKYGEAREALEAEPATKYVDLVRKMNRAHFSSTGSGKLRKLGRKLSYMANEIIPRTGYDAFVAAGDPVFEECATGLERLLDAVRSGSIDLETAKSKPDAETFAAYRDNCGNLLPTLVKRNLVDAKGEWAPPADVSKAVFDLLQRYRWATIIRSRRPALLQLTEYGRLVLMRWRIESPDAYGMSKRRSFAQRLVDDPDILPDYDATLAKAKLAYEQGELERSAEILRNAATSDADQGHGYESKITWLEDQLRPDRSRGGDKDHSPGS